MKKLILLICFPFIFNNTSMSLSTSIATLGQRLGLPEWNISERLAGTNKQTVPSYTGSGVLGSGGYIRSPVPGGVQNWPVSGGVAQGGPQSGQTVLYNSSPQNAGQVLGTQGGSGGGGGQSTGGTSSNDGQQSIQTAAQYGYPDMSMDQYNAEINNSYNAGMGAWNTAEQNANTDLANVTSTLQSGQTTDEAQLAADKTSTLGKLDTQNRAGQTKKEDAMAAARRLYSELQMGNRQRFGKATSAGQAVSEIQGAELQRQQGNTSRQANEFFQQIETAKNDVEQKFTAGLLQIKQKTTELLTQAKLNFSNLITQIAQGRAQTEQQKSQLRLNALLSLRNEAFQVQQQKVLAEQNLTQMREQARLNIEAYKQTNGANLASTGTGLQNFQNQPGASYTTPGQTSPTTQTQQVGQIYRPKSLDDQTGVVWGN